MRRFGAGLGVVNDVVDGLGSEEACQDGAIEKRKARQAVSGGFLSSDGLFGMRSPKLILGRMSEMIWDALGT